MRKTCSPWRSDSHGGTRPGNVFTCLSVIAQTLRLRHWMKNTLIFLPLLASHRLADSKSTLASLFAFLSFGCIASSIYIINDVLDRHADALHPIKKYRPIAAGLISLPFALALSFILLLAGGLIAYSLGSAVILWLVGYVVANVAYSVYLKKTLIADVIVLTLFYIVRIFVGGSAAGIDISPWLIAFCFALFFSLAACKRYAELDVAKGCYEGSTNRRAYLPVDAATIRIMGISASFAAVVILGLYVESPRALELYRHPSLLWLCCPLLLYWLLRLWVIAGRGNLIDDPLLMATTDWRSWFTGAAIGMVVFLAM